MPIDRAHYKPVIIGFHEINHAGRSNEQVHLYFFFHTEQRASLQFELLKNQFDQLNERLVNELRINSIPVSRLVDALTSLPAQLKMEYQTISSLRFPALVSEGITTDELFIVHLNPRMNFMDHGLLVYLIHKFGSDHLKEDMRSYVHKVEFFKQTTTIEDLVHVYAPVVNISDQPEKLLHIIKFQFGKEPRYITLQQLDAVRRKFCSQVKLSEIVLHLISTGTFE